MALDSMQEIFDKIAQRQISFWRVVLETDMEERQVSAQESFGKMRAAWMAMRESVEAYDGERRSVSGLVGGDGQKMRDYSRHHQTLSGGYLQEVIATALCVGESNARMRKIVAAPTAGACGALPARLSLQEKVKIVHHLQDAGILRMKGAIPEIAKQLGVSVPTVYRYLNKEAQPY